MKVAMRVREAAAASLLALLPACGGFLGGVRVLPPEEAPPPPMVVDSAERLAEPALEDVRRAPLLADVPNLSVTLVRVTGQVAPHLHRRSDETVYLLEGEGDALLAGVWRHVRAGQLLFLPRGVAHGFVNRAPGGTLALSIHTPPLLRGDLVEVPIREEAP